VLLSSNSAEITRYREIITAGIVSHVRNNKISHDRQFRFLKIRDELGEISVP
jgi:hypothetical protein